MKSKDVSKKCSALLQLALDTRSLAEAVAIAKTIRNDVDIVEVGTPLIKRYGVEAIRMVREACPHHPLVADMKTMDGGTYEAKLAFDHGADITVVMAAADPATIHKVLDVAVKRNKRVMIDLLGQGSPGPTLECVRKLDHEVILLVHSAFDRAQDVKQEQLADDARLVARRDRHLLAVAGGITPETLRALRGCHPDIVIVGSFLTSAPDLAAAARELREVLQGWE